MNTAGSTVGAYLAEATTWLRAAGVEDARREARLLLAHATGRTPEWLFAHPEAIVEPGCEFSGLVARRARREPLSHITGMREFWSLSFRVGPAVLDPRPDSETLVAAALDRFPDPAIPLRVLDLGTGSGCLLLAVLAERPAATGVGVDCSSQAAAIARDNARRLGLAGRTGFLVGDWGSAIRGRFDLVLCNPPYIRGDAIAGLAPEVAGFEPGHALDGGVDGFDAYRVLAGQLPALLAAGGIALLEFGAGQEAELPRLLAEQGIETLELRADIAGLPRCLVARRGLCPDKKMLGKQIITV